MIDEITQRLNEYVAEQIEVGIKSYINTDGSEREKALLSQVEFMKDENDRIASLLNVLQLEVDDLEKSLIALQKKYLDET